MVAPTLTSVDKSYTYYLLPAPGQNSADGLIFYAGTASTQEEAEAIVIQLSQTVGGVNAWAFWTWLRPSHPGGPNYAGSVYLLDSSFQRTDMDSVDEVSGSINFPVSGDGGSGATPSPTTWYVALGLDVNGNGSPYVTLNGYTPMMTYPYAESTGSYTFSFLDGSCYAKPSGFDPTTPGWLYALEGVRAYLRGDVLAQVDSSWWPYFGLADFSGTEPAANGSIFGSGSGSGDGGSGSGSGDGGSGSGSGDGGSGSGDGGGGSAGNDLVDMEVNSIQLLAQPANAADATRKDYVDGKVQALFAEMVDTSPEMLNTISELNAALNSDSSAFNTLAGMVSAEATARAAAISAEASARDAAVAAEASARNTAISAAVSAEASARGAAVAAESSARDTAISSAVSAEASARDDAIAAEASARDAAISSAVSAEASARDDAIAAEASARDDAIAAEASARDDAIAAEASARDDAIAAEASARNAAVAAEASARNAAVAAEASARNAAVAAEASARDAAVAAEAAARDDAIAAEAAAREALAAQALTKSDIIPLGPEGGQRWRIRAQTSPTVRIVFEYRESTDTEVWKVAVPFIKTQR